MFILIDPPRPAPVSGWSHAPKRRPHPLSSTRAVHLGHDTERFLLPSVFYDELKVARETNDQHAARWWAWRMTSVERGEEIHVTDFEASLLAAAYFLLAARSQGRISDVMRERGRRWWRRAGRKATLRTRRFDTELENLTAIFGDGDSGDGDRSI